MHMRTCAHARARRGRTQTRCIPDSNLSPSLARRRAYRLQCRARPGRASCCGGWARLGPRPGCLPRVRTQTGRLGGTASRRANHCDARLPRRACRWRGLLERRNVRPRPRRLLPDQQGLPAGAPAAPRHHPAWPAVRLPVPRHDLAAVHRGSRLVVVHLVLVRAVAPPPRAGARAPALLRLSPSCIPSGGVAHVARRTSVYPIRKHTHTRTRTHTKVHPHPQQPQHLPTC
jgi:hypothetical protein